MRVTWLDRHYLRTSADVVIDDMGWIEIVQPRPIAIEFSFIAPTGRAIGARHDVGADPIRAIGFNGRFGDGRRWLSHTRAQLPANHAVVTVCVRVVGGCLP